MAQLTSTSNFQDPGGEEVECWDDGDIQGVEDLHLRNFSVTTVASAFSSRGAHTRDSLSSRLSSKSDFEEDGDLQFQIPEDDASTSNVIADAKSRGVPLPENVPVSALLGGTIKRLGGRKIQKAMGDDWGDDLELPKADGLKLKIGSEREFPESLRQLSSAMSATTSSPSPSSTGNLSFIERLQAAAKPKLAPSPLDKFKDADFETDDVSTIRVSKNRTPGRSPIFDQSPSKSTPPRSSSRFEVPSPFLSQSPAKGPPKHVESFDDDLELPTHGELKLSTRTDLPKTPASEPIDDGDFDWADGSGNFSNSQPSVRRSGRSNRSSSISARSPSVFSPSLSSCMTAESEDEGLDGLVLPDGPLHLEEALKKRLDTASPDNSGEKRSYQPRLPLPKDDFFQDIEIGDGEVFDTGKMTLNRNVRHKQTLQTSPKRSAVTLTFTNKPVLPTTRIPKPAGSERSRTKLETVPENVGAPQLIKRAKSRLDGPSIQPSTSSIPTPSASSAVPIVPSTPSRRGLASKSSKENVRNEPRGEPMTTSAQLLKSKRSMPILGGGRNPTSPTRTHAPPFQRPSSRSGQSSRVIPSLRPKTPVDRFETGANYSRKPPVPLVPSGTASSARSITGKTSRTFHRPTSSENSNDSISASARSISRTSNHPHRQHSPVRRDHASDALAKAAASKRQVTKPVRRRAYGDGNELDAFDDLPTSSTAEAKFRKVPSVGKLPSSPALRKAYSHNVLSSSRPSSAIPPPTPTRSDSKPLPRFAQSTTASQARRQRTGAVSPEMLRRPPQFNENTQSLTATYRLQAPPKPTTQRTSNKRPAKIQQKPHLIKQLGNSANESKSIKGMHYNPALFRWEGNEQALAPFDVPVSPPQTATSTKPGLIAHIGFNKGVQVEGGMVFDPQSMRWLKMGPASRMRAATQSSTAASLVTDEDEEDPFAGIADLPDENKSRMGPAGTTTVAGSGTDAKAEHSNSDDEWVVGEEFDVGPEFIRRQRNEETKWRRRVQGWAPILTAPTWTLTERCALRDLVISGIESGADADVW